MGAKETRLGCWAIALLLPAGCKTTGKGPSCGEMALDTLYALGLVAGGALVVVLALFGALRRP
jgi:hypothetical protein